MTGPDPALVEVRATINLPGLRVGDVVLIDPTRPYEADCIRAGYLVPTRPDPATVAASTGADE